VSWIALLLIGIAVADLGHSVRPVRTVPESVGAATVVVLGLLCGLTDLRDVLAMAVIAGVVVAWGQTVRQGFGRDIAWLPLLVVGVSLAVVVLFSPLASSGAGPAGEWLDRVDLPVLADLDVDRALILLAGILLQMSTGNVIVRLVLSATGTLVPSRGPAHDSTRTLKGGRLLGPMERLVIVGLGLAGYLTAASVVVAAKGLLRFPELQAKRDSPDVLDAPGIDEVTEYFLVGSFVSWLVALSTLVLVAT
jgi:hypothetical protein